MCSSRGTGSAKVEQMEARDLNGEEIIGRLRLCEDSLKVINHEKLSPFKQQEVLQRLDDLDLQISGVIKDNEKVLAVTTAPVDIGQDSPTHSDVASPVVMIRAASTHSLSILATPSPIAAPQDMQALQGIAERVAGLEGKLAGVYNLGGKLMALEEMAAEMGIEVVDVEYQAAALAGDDAPSTSGVTTGDWSVAHLFKQRAGDLQQLQEKSTTALGRQSGSRGARLIDMASQLEKLTVQSTELQSLVGVLQAEVGTLSGAMTAGDDALGQRVAAVETASLEMREGLAAQIEMAKKELKREPEVSFADFTALSSKVSTAATDLSSATASLKELKDQGLGPMQEAISSMKEQVRKANEPRDMDTLFHQRLGKVEALVGDVHSSVQLAVQDIMSDVAKVSDLEMLEQAMESLALVTDLRQLATQQAALTQSVNGMAEWLAMRPETADGVKNTGASATRFKCLTCDREIRTQQGTPPQESRARGTLLPRLEPMAASHGGPPLGPGINAAEMRRLADERISTLTRTSPVRGAEFDDYVGAEGRGKGAAGGRHAVLMPNSAFVPKAVPGVPRTPVFI